MKRHHIQVILLYLLLAFTAVPVTFAQSTSDLEFGDILNALGPRTGEDLIFDILLYIIFFLTFINMFLIPDKQMFVTILNFTVMGFAIVSKLLIGDGLPLEATDLPVLVLNVGMFTIPLVIAGMLRSVKGKPSRAMLPAILTGLIGGGYFFLFWFLKQRDGVMPTL